MSGLAKTGPNRTDYWGTGTRNPAITVDTVQAMVVGHRDEGPGKGLTVNHPQEHFPGFSGLFGGFDRVHHVVQRKRGSDFSG